MADTKISALTALTGANVEHAADSIPIVDDSVTTAKRILVSELAKALEVLATEQASTSGTEIDFTSIPAWAKRITIQLVGVSTNGTSIPIVQIGDSGGVETSSYAGNCCGIGTSTGAAAFTSGFGLSTTSASAADTRTGHVVLTLEDSANNTWVCSGVVATTNNTFVYITAGTKTLSAALDRVRITTVNGLDTFDAGAINIIYE